MEVRPAGAEANIRTENAKGNNKKEIFKMDTEWKQLYDIAMEKINPHEISGNMYAGAVSAVVLTKSGKIYTGVCIDTSSSLGMCAERNALSTMISNNEYEVDKVLAVYKDGTVMPPCGACREFMMQLGTSAKDIQILVDNQGKVMRLPSLMPEYPYEG